MYFLKYIYIWSSKYFPVSLCPKSGIISEKISIKLKKKVKIKYKKNFEGSDRSKYREIFVRYCDSSKIKKAINWEPLIKVDKGIEKILKSLKNA